MSAGRRIRQASKRIVIKRTMRILSPEGHATGQFPHYIGSGQSGGLLVAICHLPAEICSQKLWRAHAPNALIKFWRRARHPQRSFPIRERSTLSVLKNGGPSYAVSDSGTTGVQRFHFCRVRAVGTRRKIYTPSVKRRQCRILPDPS